MITYKSFAEQNEWIADTGDFGLPETEDSELLVDKHPVYSSDSLDVYKAYDPYLAETVLLYMTTAGYGCVVPYGSQDNVDTIMSWDDDVYKALVASEVIELNYRDRWV